ncbi:MAG: hypothetical protein ACR65Z_12350 [Methylocystis sp.]
MSNIPEARRILKQIVEELKEKGDYETVERLIEVESLLVRRPAARIAPIQSQPVTPEVRALVLKLAKTTDLQSSQIAAQLNVNPGRVSEILQGDR